MFAIITIINKNKNKTRNVYWNWRSILLWVKQYIIKYVFTVVVTMIIQIIIIIIIITTQNKFVKSEVCHQNQLRSNFALNTTQWYRILILLNTPHLIILILPTLNN